MSAGFDEFLNELRGQLVRVADEQAAPERAARRTPVREGRFFGLAPRRALAWAAVLAVGTAALVGGLLIAHPDDPASFSTSGLVSSPGSNHNPANVQPVSPIPIGTPSATSHAATASGYSLAAVAAAGAADVWAVGARLDPAPPSPATGSVPASHSFILHYDGAAWREMPSPDIGPLAAVAAAAPGDVWALAAAGSLLHWDGREWTVAPEPMAGGVVALHGLAAAPGGVWAAGSRDGSPLLAQWDGAAWHVADLPVPPTGAGDMKAVSGTAVNDIWAVGGSADGSSPLVLHWNGAQWSYVADDAEGGAGLTAVAVGPNDVWAGGPGVLQHWDGTRWLAVPQDFGGVRGSLVALPSGDIWAEGATGLAQWDGTRWSCTDLGQLVLGESDGVTLEGLAVLPTGEAWAVGGVADLTGALRPLVIHCVAHRWSIELPDTRPE